MAPASMAIASCSPYVTIVAWSMLPARMEVSQGTKAAPACDRFLRRLAHLERVRGPARQGVALHEVGLERRRTVPHRNAMTWFLRPNGFFLRRARWAVVSSARPLPELAAEETAT